MNIFGFLNIVFILYRRFSGVRKCDVRKNFYWNKSFCDTQIEGIPKSAIIIEFPLCCNSLFSENTRLSHLTWVSITIVPLVEKYSFGKSEFCILRHNPHSPKALKVANIIQISYFSNCFFTATTGLISTIKISNDSPLL